MSLTIIDPERGSIKNDGSLSKVQDRVLRSDLLRVRRDGARSHKRYIYDELGLALGIVTLRALQLRHEDRPKEGSLMATLTSKFKLNGLDRQISITIADDFSDFKTKQADLDLRLADLGAQASAPEAAVTPATTEVTCADCGNACEGTSAFGRAPAYTALVASQKRSEKISDPRNSKDFAGLNMAPRLLCAPCWKPYRERLDLKFKSR